MTSRVCDIFIGTKLMLSVDDYVDNVYVEGTSMGSINGWDTIFQTTVSKTTPVVALELRNTGGPGMLLAATTSGILSRVGNPTCSLSPETGKEATPRPHPSPLSARFHPLSV